MSSGPFELACVLRLSRADDDEGILLLITSGVEGKKVVCAESLFSMRLWFETPKTLRASVTNLRTGRTAMIEGNEALLRLAAEAEIEMVDRNS